MVAVMAFCHSFIHWKMFSIYLSNDICLIFSYVPSLKIKPSANFSTTFNYAVSQDPRASFNY